MLSFSHMVFREQISLKTIGILLLTFVLGFNNVSAQVLVKDTVKGKSFEIAFGSKIYYKLHSDSVLGVELSEDYGILTTTEDSLLILQDGVEISANDISFIEIENKKLIKWRGIMSPFFIAGLGFLSKGVTMALGEGLESKNKEWVPLYAGIGGGVTILSGIPFFLKNKSFNLSKGKYQIITP